MANNKNSKDYRTIFTKIMAAILVVLMVLAVGTTTAYYIIAGLLK